MMIRLDLIIEIFPCCLLEAVMETSDLELELGQLFGIALIYSIAVSTFPDTILQLVTPRT